MKRLLVCLLLVLLSVLVVGSQLHAQNAPKRFVVNSIGMKLTLIPAGEFMMGSPASDAEAFKDERPQHRAIIAKPFYLAVHEVTQSQYQKVMARTFGARPWPGKRNVKAGADFPASYVSYDDATSFCSRLSRHEGVEYRLPTEAEWEYACRAGTITVYSFGDDASKLGQYAWYDKNAVCCVAGVLHLNHSTSDLPTVSTSIQRTTVGPKQVSVWPELSLSSFTALRLIRPPTFCFAWASQNEGPEGVLHALG